MEQSSFLNFLESEKLSEEKLKIAKGQLNTLRYQSFAMRFLNEQDTDESSDVPKNVLMRKLSCSSKYTCFYPVLIYDEDFPEEAVSFEEIFLEAFKILENSERTQHILDYFQDRYEQDGEQMTIRLFAGNVGYYEGECFGGDGTTVNKILAEVLNSQEDKEDNVINVHTRQKNPIRIAEIVCHELVHQQHNNTVFTEVLKNSETVDVQELMLMLYCDELFAYTVQRAFAFEKLRVSSDILTNYLALLQKEGTKLSHRELGTKSALAFIQLMMNDIDPKNIPQHIPNMNENYLFGTSALKCMKEKKDKHEDLYLEAVDTCVPYLVKRDIPVQKITFEGKKVRQVFNRFISLHFPEFFEDMQHVNVEQKSLMLMQSFPVYAKPYLKFNEKYFKDTIKIIGILKRFEKAFVEQKKLLGSPVVITRQKEVSKSQKHNNIGRN